MSVSAPPGAFPMPMSVRISTPVVWLEVNDGIDYSLAKEAFSERMVSKRVSAATSPYLEGSYAVNAMREQVTEQLAVLVYGNSPYALGVNLEILLNALDQIEYRIVKVDGNRQEVWYCQSAGYRIETAHEMQHACMAKVTAEVPRHPVRSMTGPTSLDDIPATVLAAMRR